MYVLFQKKRKDSQERPSSATPKTGTSTDVSLSGPPKKQASVDDLLDLDLGASTTTTDGKSRTTSNNISYSSTNPFASSTAGMNSFSLTFTSLCHYFVAAVLLPEM